MRCLLGNTISLEDLVGRLSTFDLSNFDNYKHKNIESTSKAKLSLKEHDEKKKKKKIKYVSSDSDIDKENVEQLEALLVKDFIKVKENLKVSYLSCVSIATRFVILLLDEEKLQM